MPKLHETVVTVGDRKSTAQKSISEAYKILDKPDLFDAVYKTYSAANAGDTETFPPDNKHAQKNLTELVKATAAEWASLFDVILTMDVGNQKAKGDIELDGKIVAKDVPVPTLLFLEKQLTEMKAFVARLPVPDPSEVWTKDAAQNRLATVPTQTHRTKKVQRPIVLYDATDKHPAQTQLIQEDVTTGFWTTIKYTSRVPADIQAAMLTRVTKLLEAVQVARTRANNVEIDKKVIGAELVKFVFDQYAPA